jgi:hypothetical protein
MESSILYVINKVIKVLFVVVRNMERRNNVTAPYIYFSFYK